MFPARFRFVLAILLVVCWSVADIHAQTRRRTPRPGPGATVGSSPGAPLSPAKEPQTQWTGVWEPINYPDDVDFHELYFVSAQEGWASATKGSRGAMILHTSDGGGNWDVQLGDPESQEERFQGLHFLDASHGWTVQKGGKLVRTSDGKNWEEAGALPQFHPLSAYAFTSPANGVVLAGYANNTEIFVTRDGGKNWKSVYHCATKIQQNGLFHQVGCSLNEVRFASASVGYAVGGGYNGGFGVVAKTEDGGSSWRLIFSTTEIETVDSVFFTSDSKGFIATHDSKIYVTEDGGQNWRGLVATATADLKFADPEVGWSCEHRLCTFTTNGGQTWSSKREFAFPAMVRTFSIPRRDRIYVAGDNGMIYRYKIIRTDEVTKTMIPAPAMPGYGGQLNTDLDKMRTRIKVLQTKLNVPAAPAAASSSAAADQNSATADSAQGTGLIGSQTETAQDSQPSQASQETTAMAPEGASAEAPAAAGDQAAFPAADASASTSMSTDFVQDTAAAQESSFVQNCCAAQIQGLQTDLNSVGQQVPTFSSKYKNLNLLFVGMNMFSDLVNKARGMKDAFVALKKAPNLQAATAALQNLSAQLDSTSQAVTSGFQNLSSGGSAGAFGSAGGVISNTVGAFSGESGADASAPVAAPASTDNTTQKKEEKPKKKLKLKLPGGITWPQ